MKTALLAGAFALAASSALAAAQGPQAPNPAVIAAAAKPTPKMQGKPNLTGVWMRPPRTGLGGPQHYADGSICVAACDPKLTHEIVNVTMSTFEEQGIRSQGPDRPKYKQELVAKVIDLEKNQIRHDPVLKCNNPGLPRIGPPDKIVQIPGQIVILYEDVNGSYWRIIPTDGRPHNPNAEKTALGEGVAHWEGDTLVIVTKNFNDETWLIDDGAFHSDKLTVTERLKRVGDTLVYDVVAEDPDVLAEPWRKRTETLVLTKDEPLEAPPCQDQSVDLIVDGSYHDNAR